MVAEILFPLSPHCRGEDGFVVELIDYIAGGFYKTTRLQENKTIYLFAHSIDYEVEFIYLHPCSNNDVRVCAKQQYRKRQV